MKKKTIYDFYGRIIGKRKNKKGGSGRFKEYYALEVEIMGKPEIKELEAYQNLVSEEIWENIINANYYNQNFTFYSIKYGKFWRLVNWRKDN